jgi:prepilin-type N-terminal cleavage/methylation domain-containing protein
MNKIRFAFTLVELMVVVVIITLLAALGSAAYFSAMQSARETRTVSIIAKLDAAISDIYESYEFRFEHIEDALEDASRVIFETNRTSMTETQVIELKRKLMYDLMRMEMPSTHAEVNAPPTTVNIVIPPTSTLAFTLAPPAAQQVYLDNINGVTSSTFGTESAELLYLIIANLDPEALENFTASEIGDTNDNGLSEFIDGWGRPIAFMRFAPGFTDTDKQPDLKRIIPSLASSFGGSSFDVIDELHQVTVTGVTVGANGVSAKDQIIGQWQDPFDPEKIEGASWFLYPVVMSAGRDGEFGVIITRTDNSDAPEPLYDPFSPGALIGTPNGTHHHDNIHNHTNYR